MPVHTKQKIKGYQTIHAKNRAEERFGVHLTPANYQDMLRQIKTGEAHQIHQISRTRAIFNLQFEGKDLFALYNAKTKRIVTFLTKEQIYGDKETAR